MRRIETQVLVVGAGPAGSMAAKFAARGGARTLLIEKRQEIGAPVRCAEGVSCDWMAECEVAPDPRWIATTPEGARIHAPGGACAVVSAERAGNEVGMVLERSQFDKALAEHAAEAGADILLKTHASDVLREDGAIVGIVGKTLGEDVEIRAAITIGADGFESQMGRWAGIQPPLKTRDVDATFQYRLTNVECDPRYCDFYVGSAAPGGYIWVFPKGPRIANVGIGVQLALLRGKADTKRYLDDWVARQPALARGRPLDMVAGAVSTCPPPRRTVASGLMLVGDAARLIDPLTGGGIVNACLSGKFAGEIAAGAARAGDAGEDALGAYERAWRSRLERKLLRNWLAKERLITLDDPTLDAVVTTLAEVDLGADTLSLLTQIARRHPALVEGFAELLVRV